MGEVDGLRGNFLPVKIRWMAQERKEAVHECRHLLCQRNRGAYENPIIATGVTSRVSEVDFARSWIAVAMDVKMRVIRLSTESSRFYPQRRLFRGDEFQGN